MEPAKYIAPDLEVPLTLEEQTAVWGSDDPAVAALGDGVFDRICALAALNLRTPLALVTLVTAEQQYFKGLYGTLPEPWQSRRRTPLDYSFCQHVVAKCSDLVVSDARHDPLVRDNRAVPELGIVAYLGVPLMTHAGLTVGSFSVIDRKSRAWEAEEMTAIHEMAALVMVEIELRLSRHHLEKRLDFLDAERERREEEARQLVHDLRTPLNSLLLGLRTIPMLGGINPGQQEVLDIARRCGQTLATLVDDLLDAGATQAQGQALTFTRELDAADLMAKAVGQVATLAAHRALTLTVDVAAGGQDGSELTVDADGNRLVRALVNLLANAVKFTPFGGKVSFSGREDRLALGVSATVFTVRDTGPGIAAEHHDRIFERYVRLDDPGDDVSPQHSSGLGLSFVRAVAQAHGGRVELDSTPGAGSAFTLIIPRRQPAVRP